MSLKRKIDKTAFDALDEVVKGFYEEKDGKFFLKLEDDGEGELRRAFDRQKEELKILRDENKSFREKIEDADGLDARKRGDIETLERSWKEKNEKLQKELTDKLSAKDAYIRQSLIDANASQIAAKISTVPNLMAGHIKSRLDVDFSGEAPVLRVLDKAGKPTALTLDELQKEIVENDEYAAIIVGSKASGSNASKEGQGGKGSAGTSTKSEGWNSLSKEDKLAALRQKREQQ